MDFKNLFRELRRRNVFRAVLAYLAVAWVLIEVASTILPTFNAPEHLLKGLIYLLAVGLVIWTGFSWVYDLTPQGIQRTPEEYDTAQTRELNSRRLNAVIIGAGLTALLVLLVGSFWVGSKWGSEKVLANNKEYRIAVLPFEDRSDNAEYEYLREGLAEDVIGKLFDFSGVSVISSRSSFEFKDSDKSIEQISRELSADIVLIGNYTVTNQKVDVKMEIIDTREDEILNYASIVGDLGHIRDISNKIGAKLKESLGLVSTDVNGTSGSAMQEVNPEAFKWNALGKSAMRDNTGQKLEEITRYFEAAIELDPTYVDPYIGMAEAYIFDVNRGYISTTEAAQKAREYLVTAEKLNPGCGEVSGILGILHTMDFKFKSSVPYFEKSLEKSPNYSLAYHWYSFTMEILGDFDKAEELQKKAAILDPLNAFNDYFLAMNYIYQEKYRDAEALIDSKLSLDPGSKQMLWIKAVLLVEMGDYQQAHEVLLKREYGLETNFVSGFVFARLGQEERARNVLHNMLGGRFVSPSQLAIVYCGLEEYELAMEQVEKGFLEHDSWFGWVVFTSMTDPIKDDPRYVSLIAQLAED